MRQNDSGESQMIFMVFREAGVSRLQETLIFNSINNSLHLARKYARIFVRRHYLFLEANSFPRAKLEENCELRGTDNVQGQISEDIFAAKLRLLCLLSIGFKN